MKLLNIRNYLRKLVFVELLGSCFILISCPNLKHSSAPISPLKTEGRTYSLEIKGNTGRKEVTHYYSGSYIKSFEGQQLVREKQEDVEFEVQVNYIREDSSNGFIHTLAKTINKDGVVNLHELAFPELNERMEVVYKKDAEIVYAGEYPRSSIFYVPPLSLPNEPVKVGDTWEMQKSWIGDKNSIPLHIDLVTIFKNVYPCGQETCADLEVSGEVSIIASLNKNTNFKSEVSGRILFSIDKGVIVWSLLNSKEAMDISDNHVEVLSCLLSHLTEPKREIWRGVQNKHCDPKKMEVAQVPGTVSL